MTTQALLETKPMQIVCGDFRQTQEIDTIRFVGDVHGNLGALLGVVRSVPARTLVFQIGDLGVNNDAPSEQGWIHSDQCVNGPWVFIPGNHDNPESCKKIANRVPSGNLLQIGRYSAMALGGGLSTDKSLRTMGLDWWEDEEHSFGELQRIIDQWDEWKPDILVSHVPSGEYMERIGKSSSGILLPGSRNIGRTGAAIDAMFEKHRPKLHVFGHMHYRRTEIIGGVQCECLGQYGGSGWWLDVDVSQ